MELLGSLSTCQAVDCQKQLEQAEARVEILLKKAGGEMVAETFEPESEEEV